MTRAEFLAQLGITDATLCAWVACGWVRDAGELDDAALARATLVRELVEALEVNEAGVDVALALLDQVHALRRALRMMADSLDALPPALREEARRAIERHRPAG